MQGLVHLPLSLQGCGNLPTPRPGLWKGSPHQAWNGLPCQGEQDEGEPKQQILYRGASKSTPAFNEAYRYVDWILTVPLLLAEVVAVLALAKEISRSMMGRLVPASAAMIILGYPGEISNSNSTKVLFGILSTLPFIYILYVLFVELGKSFDRQPEGVAATIGRLRLLLIATWGVYPISYLIPILVKNPSASQMASLFTDRQIGYTVADVLAKCVFGLTIFKIARLKSAAEGMADSH